MNELGKGLATLGGCLVCAVIGWHQPILGVFGLFVVAAMSCVIWADSENYRAGEMGYCPTTDGPSNKPPNRGSAASR
jgi:hypothetical protein